MRNAQNILAVTLLLTFAITTATTTGCRETTQATPSFYVYRGPLAKERGAYVKEIYSHDPVSQKYTLSEAYMDTTGDGNANLHIKFANDQISELRELAKISTAAYWPTENSKRPDNSEAPAALVNLFDATHTPPTTQTLEEFYATPPANSTRIWQLATQLRNAKDELADKIISDVSTALTQGRLPVHSAHILAGYDGGILALVKILKDTNDPLLAQITSQAIRISPKSAAPAIADLIAALEKNRPEAMANIFQTLEYEISQSPENLSRALLNSLDRMAKTRGEEFNNHVKRIWLITVDKETAQVILARPPPPANNNVINHSPLTTPS